MGRRDALLGHIIPIPSQPVFALIPKCYQNRSQNPHSTTLELETPILPHSNSKPTFYHTRTRNLHSTTLEASMLNITKPMWLSYEEGGIQN